MIKIEIEFVDGAYKQVSIGEYNLFKLHDIYIYNKAECLELAKVFEQAADELCEWPEDR